MLLWSAAIQTGAEDRLIESSHRDLHISVRLMANKLFGALFDDLGFCERPEGCHGDCGHRNRNHVHGEFVHHKTT